MSLQRRLTLFFVFIVILPLVAAGFIVQRVIIGEISRRADLSLRPALDATVAIYNGQIEALDRRVRAVVANDRRFARLVARGDEAALRELLHDRLDDAPDLDFMAVFLDDDFTAFTSRPGAFVQGAEQPTEEEILAAPPGTGRGFARTAEIPLAVDGGTTSATMVGGIWLDDDLLVAASRSSVDLSIVAGGRIIASTVPLGEPMRVDVDYRDTFTVDLDERARASATSLGSGVGVVASTRTGPVESLSRQVLISMLALLAVALLLTVGLAYRLARLITEPLEELARGADAITEGRYGHQIAVQSRDEVGQLATAFNDMSARLAHTISELSSSQEQMKRAVRRVGETLRSTHDMRQMLESILNTAADAVDAEAAVMWMFSPSRDELNATLTTGVRLGEARKLSVGEGVAGQVAERAIAISVPGEGKPVPSPSEPPFPVALAIPLYSQNRMMGVVSAYRRQVSRPFTTDDVDTVTFLVEQGGVALENVRLHEEAQRLAITDGLTGVWNKRYFQMQFRQTIATAQRFHRPFSILMMDLDHFKTVNDNHGHQRGDSVLIEFSQRVTKLLREVDTFARYGGEEFICLLSETDIEGAMTTAEKIHDAIRGEPFGGMDDELLNVTVSVGVAAYPEHGDTYKSLVEAADRALYQAKQRGRDQVCLAKPQLKSA